MKMKNIRILTIVAVVVLTLSLASTTFAASVSTTTSYLVNSSGDAVTQVQVESAVSGGTANSNVSYLVTQGTNQSPTSSNVLYLNQYQLDGTGATTITYKLNISALEAANYATTVRFGSSNGDTFTGGDLGLEKYRVISNGDGTFTVLPTEGYEITTVEVNGTAVSPLALTYAPSSNGNIAVEASAITSGTVGNDKIAAATPTINSTALTVNWFLQPVANSGVTEIGVAYGNLLFPALTTSGDPSTVAKALGITNVKLDFSGQDVIHGNYTFAGEAAKVTPYYKVGGVVYYYDGSAFVAE